MGRVRVVLRLCLGLSVCATLLLWRRSYQTTDNLRTLAEPRKYRCSVEACAVSWGLATSEPPRRSRVGGQPKEPLRALHSPRKGSGASDSSALLGVGRRRRRSVPA